MDSKTQKYIIYALILSNLILLYKSFVPSKYNPLAENFNRASCGAIKIKQCKQLGMKCAYGNCY